MFFCRHHILRASIQRHFEYLLGKKRIPHLNLPINSSILVPSFSNGLSTISFPVTLDSDARAPPQPPSLAHQVLPEIDTQDHEDQGSTARSSHKIQSLNDKFFKNPTDSYLALRNENPTEVLDLSVDHLSAVVTDVFRKERLDLLPMLVDDAVQLTRQHPTRSSDIISVILRRFTAQRNLTKAQILRLFTALHDAEQLQYVKASARMVIAMRLMTYDLRHTTDAKLFELLGPWLAESIPKEPPWTRRIPGINIWEKSSDGALVPKVFWPLFRVILSLALKGNTERASAIVAELANTQGIPPNAIKATELTSTDYVYVVLSVLVRTCLLFGWYERASTLLVPTVAGMAHISLPLAQLIEDWMSAGLTDPRDKDLENIASMLVLLLKRTEAYTVPARLIQSFYTAAIEANQRHLVQTIFRHSQHPPLNDNLVWLMRHFDTGSHNVHLARTLATRVVEDNLYLPTTSRADFIILAATMGFRSQARALYERFSTGPDRLFVVGRSAVMTRLVSAFVKAESHARRAATLKATNAGAEEAARPRRNLQEEDAEWKGDQEEDVHGTLDDGVEEDHPGSDAPPPRARPSPPPQWNSELPPSSERADASAPEEEQGEVVCGSVGFRGLSSSEVLERADELRRFAERVFDEYRKALEPLGEAGHYDLNALARGAVMLRQDSLAFEVFAGMKRRGTKLDIFDLNVALSVVARASPAAGAARVERLIEEGYKPDGVTYGTVIHWAIVHGDGALVGELLQRARARKAEVPFKTLGSLLHATVSEEMLDEGTAGSRLESAREIVEEMVGRKMVPTANMGRDCVVAALHADEPETAWTFWRRFVKGKVEWGDPGQRGLRKRIGMAVGRHCAEGRLEEERGRAMVRELGFDMAVWLRVGRGRGGMG